MSSVKFCCPFCAKLFTDESGGVQHAEVVHSKEAALYYQFVPRQCLRCLKSFKVPWSFIQHMEQFPICRDFMMQQQQDTESGTVEQDIVADTGNVARNSVSAAKKVSVGKKRCKKNPESNKNISASRKRKSEETCCNEPKHLRAATSEDVGLAEDSEHVEEATMDPLGQQQLTTSHRKKSSNPPHISTVLSESEMLSQLLSDPSVDLNSVIDSLDVDAVSQVQWKHTAFTMRRAMHGVAVSLYTEIIKCETEKLSSKQIKNQLRKHLLAIMAAV